VIENLVEEATSLSCVVVLGRNSRKVMRLTSVWIDLVFIVHRLKVKHMTLPKMIEETFPEFEQLDGSVTLI